MDDLSYTGRLFVEGKSIHLLISREDGKEQENLVCDVKSNASLCLQYDKWIATLENFELPDELKLINVDQLTMQVNMIMEEAKMHDKKLCSCSEDLESRFFKRLELRKNEDDIVLSLVVFVNAIDALQTIEVVRYTSITSLVKSFRLIYRYGQKEHSFNGCEELDLFGIKHIPKDVLFSLGMASEGYFIINELDMMILKELNDDLDKALEFQASFLE